MDVHTRAVRGWYLSRSLDRELTLTALRRALADRVPDIHHSDQGVQISMAAIGGDLCHLPLHLGLLHPGIIGLFVFRLCLGFRWWFIPGYWLCVIRRFYPGVIRLGFFRLWRRC
jgi:transposase InsO family protein